MTVIAGALAIFGLPIAQYPEIAPPTVTVTTVYPGANAKTVAETVATPIEEQVNGVENMLYMSSQCTNDGAMKLTVTFKVGHESRRRAGAGAEPRRHRPAAAPARGAAEGITVKKASPDITLVVALYSPDNSHDTLFMSNYATLQIKDEIARLPGVGDITIFGVRDYSMRLWLDPDKLAARSMTAGDVVNAVREQNVQVAAGIIGGPPLPTGASQFQYTMNVQGRLTDPAQFANMVVNVGQDGRITQLKDVGRVELAAADYSTAMTFDGRPGGGHRRLPAARLERHPDRQRHLREDGGTEEALPAGGGLHHPLRHHALRARQHPGRREDALRRRRAGGAGGARLPAKLARRASCR